MTKHRVKVRRIAPDKWALVVDGEIVFEGGTRDACEREAARLADAKHRTEGA